MISYQEALNIMCVRCVIYDDCKSKNCTSNKSLQELVDKATPKKPIGKYTNYRCPVCNRRVRSGKGSSSFVRDNVCQRCFQVLDWCDEDD